MLIKQKEENAEYVLKPTLLASKVLFVIMQFLTILWIPSLFIMGRFLWDFFIALVVLPNLFWLCYHLWLRSVRIIVTKNTLIYRTYCKCIEVSYEDVSAMCGVMNISGNAHWSLALEVYDDNKKLAFSLGLKMYTKEDIKTFSEMSKERIIKARASAGKPEAVFDTTPAE